MYQLMCRPDPDFWHLEQYPLAAEIGERSGSSPKRNIDDFAQPILLLLGKEHQEPPNAALTTCMTCAPLNGFVMNPRAPPSSVSVRVELWISAEAATTAASGSSSRSFCRTWS